MTTWTRAAGRPRNQHAVALLPCRRRRGSADEEAGPVCPVGPCRSGGDRRHDAEATRRPRGGQRVGPTGDRRTGTGSSAAAPPTIPGVQSR
ncbi:hypothetical protein IscW_ISCW018845 [Ixodes scapularis]|uniref:Uncharacterized protein n=1 Tax=Ixodes scapularis TaxID=6945 RepID=B7PNE5_IXOSC|nr:hypothetical protein IscW_ISCW018845 [Ixodes scapularis]|eukprot:XP_002435293.1 hypothetical protein IscW_ISCW018845 [Ixodes scapularis]